MLAARVRSFLFVLATAAMFVVNVSAQNAPEQSEVPGASARMGINGRVIDDLTGKPLAGATVTLYDEVMHVSLRSWTPSPAPHPAPSTPPQPSQPRETITGADGE